ncbi:hypothetical protein [Bradyrhizobium sp. STM 3561]|uniref:hypothetical protein n=1 Tax=Bradyrhizobium sp. STM 3561 TaxID=578923 RepID=UPI0038909649
MRMPPREPFICKRFIKNYRFAKGDRRNGQFAYVGNFPRNPPAPGKTKNPGLFEQDTGLHTRFDMKNHTATTAERAGKNVASIQLLRFRDNAVADRFRSVVHESFACPWPDFIGAVLAMFCDAKRIRLGTFQFFGRTVCDVPVCGVSAAAGFCRWRMPGADGVNAPSVVLEPSGRVFWQPPNGGAPRRVWSFGELVRIVGYCRPSGWRAV